MTTHIIKNYIYIIYNLLLICSNLCVIDLLTLIKLYMKDTRNNILQSFLIK